jgi:hypothetical protein
MTDLIDAFNIMATINLSPGVPLTTKTLRAQCYCKAVQFTVTVPTSALPLAAHLCHCPICRQTHGSLCIFHAALPAGINPVFSESIVESAVDLGFPGASVTTSLPSTCSTYRHSQALSDRFFCSTCGCHIGDCDTPEAPDPDSGLREWRVATSIFAAEDQPFFQIRSHVFTQAAVGIGIHKWVTEISGHKLHSWNPGPDMTIPFPNVDDRLHPEPEFSSSDGVERLRAECHCGGVSFTFPRPTVPEITEDDRLVKTVSHIDKTKYLATLDVCDDCRLCTGTHVIGWTFVPRIVMQPMPEPNLEGFGTLKAFRSSKDVIRGFCGTCGATVFFHYYRDTWGDVLDVAVGILRAPEGIAAEKWLTWRAGRLSWHDDGQKFDADFTAALKEGYASWGMKEYGQSLEFEIG